MKQLSKFLIGLCCFVLFSCNKSDQDLDVSVAASVQLRTDHDYFDLSQISSERFVAEVADPFGMTD